MKEIENAREKLPKENQTTSRVIEEVFRKLLGSFTNSALANTQKASV